MRAFVHACMCLIYIVYWHMYFDFVYPLLQGRNYPKGLVGPHLRHLRGVGILQHPPHSESRLSESEEIWSPSDISESDSGIGWSISGLWFCTGCPSSSCKEIKLLIKKVCIVNETINSCNEKKLLIENFEMIRTFQVKC